MERGSAQAAIMFVAVCGACVVCEVCVLCEAGVVCEVGGVCVVCVVSVWCSSGVVLCGLRLAMNGSAGGCRRKYRWYV